MLQAIRDKMGAAITINSAYRTKSHNAKVGGSQSFHLYGRAADIVVADKTPKEVAACAESVGALGILRHETFVYVDTRTTKYFAVYTNGIPTAVTAHGGVLSSGIAQIRSTLNARYNTGLTVSGVYGANAKKAMIKRLQTELNRQYNKGLGVDGCWDPKTKAACPIIYGGGGNIQYIVQAGLYCIAGVTSLSVDGIYGPNTVSAVREFQREKKLSSVDGQIGPDTFAE